MEPLSQPQKNINPLTNESQEVMYELARHAYLAGDYTEAYAHFCLLTWTQPQKRLYWLGLAAALQMMKRYQEALEAYGVAASIDEKDAMLFFHTAECLYALGQLEPACRALQAAVDLASQHPKLKAKALSLEQLLQEWLKKLNSSTQSDSSTAGK